MESFKIYMPYCYSVCVNVSVCDIFLLVMFLVNFEVSRTRGKNVLDQSENLFTFSV